MKNIHVISTDKPSRLYMVDSIGKLDWSEGYLHQVDGATNQNIYITSEEEIKEGDWFLFPSQNIVLKSDDNSLRDRQDLVRKIILTTDQDLIKDGVQAVDDDFLEWFVKNPSCEEVEVEYQTAGLKSGVWQYDYKIIIPKEEPKQEIVGYRLKPSIDRMMVDGMLKNAMPIWNDKDKSVYFIRGHVAGSLVAKMKELQVLDLWFTPIYENEEVKSDWLKENHLKYYHKEGIMSDNLKQETLEEAAETNSEKHHYAFGQQSEFYQIGFIEGVKWQQEKSQKIVPFDAVDIEVFAIKPDEDGKLFAYIGYKISNDNFHFNVVPFTEPQQERMYSEKEVLNILDIILSEYRESLNNKTDFYPALRFEQFKKK